eukprot:11845459-Alexandrium_andersonii.AAC.1
MVFFVRSWPSRLKRASLCSSSEILTSSWLSPAMRGRLTSPGLFRLGCSPGSAGPSPWGSPVGGVAGGHPWTWPRRRQ